VCAIVWVAAQEGVPHLDSERIEAFVDIARLFAKKCHHQASPAHIAK